MTRLSNKVLLWRGEPAVYCPGCDMMHRIHVSGPAPNGSRWTWNNNPHKPTFHPSIHVRHKVVCHSFLRNGTWQYLNDCTHELAGQHIPLPDLPDWAT